jgi:predicted nuclease with TOPRIM domain
MASGAPPARSKCGDTIARMLDDLEALRGKLTELNARVRMLREENQHLRAQVSDAQVELDALRGRVSGAVQRVDELLARLPAEPHPAEPAR